MIQAPVQPTTSLLSHSITLTVSDILAIAGLVGTLISVGIAYRQFKKAESAEQAVENFRDRLRQQRAALLFSEISPQVVMLASRIRLRDWPVCAELVVSINARLSNAIGFCTEIVFDDDRPSLQLAANALEYIFQQIPAEGVNPEQNPDLASIQEMSRGCMLIIYSIEVIAGRFRSLDDRSE